MVGGEAGGRLRVEFELVTGFGVRRGGSLFGSDGQQLVEY
jgi:hypothetical protein